MTTNLPHQIRPFLSTENRPRDRPAGFRRVLAVRFQAGAIAVFIRWRWLPSAAPDPARALGHGAANSYFVSSSGGRRFSGWRSRSLSLGEGLTDSTGRGMAPALMVCWIEGGAGFFLFSVLPGGAVELPGRSRPAPGVVAIRWGTASTLLAALTRAREAAPIPARSDADRPAPAGWAALRLLADVDISF